MSLLVCLLVLCSDGDGQLPIKSQIGTWVEAGGTGSGGRRYALILGVGRYNRHEAWSLPWVSADLDLVGDTLRDKAGFTQVLRLEDEHVSEGTIQGSLSQIESWFAGEDNLVLVYWVGHGYVDKYQETRFFLSHTEEVPREGGAPEYQFTLGEGDLGRLFASLRQQAGSRVVFVADACRVKTMGPPADRRPVEALVADVCLYSTQRGSFATPAVGQKHSLFGECFATTLGDLSAGISVSLGQLYEVTRTRMAERSGDQVPELAIKEAALRDLKLRDRANLSLRIEVFDAFRNVELKGAELNVDDAQHESPATIKGLVDGTHRLEVAKAGFFRTLTTLELDDKQSGGVFRVDLYPEFEVLEGVVKDAAGAPAPGTRCSLEGDRSQFLTGYHRDEAMSDADGSYRLLIPRGSNLKRIVFDLGASEPYQVPLDIASHLPKEKTVAGGIVTRTYDLGTAFLPSGTVVRVEDLGLTGEAANMWLSAEEQVSVGEAADLDLAIGNYQQALRQASSSPAQEVIKSRIRTAYLNLLSHLLARGKYRAGGDQAKRALQVFPDDPEFTQSLALCERESIPGELREHLRSASQARERGNYRQALELYAGLLRVKEQLTAYYQKEVAAAHSGVVDKLFQDALVRMFNAWRAGNEPEARVAYRDAREVNPQHPVLDTWQRKFFEAAIERLETALRAGDKAAALAAYRDAREVNPEHPDLDNWKRTLGQDAQPPAAPNPFVPHAGVIPSPVVRPPPDLPPATDAESPVIEFFDVSGAKLSGRAILKGPMASIKIVVRDDVAVERVLVNSEARRIERSGPQIELPYEVSLDSRRPTQVEVEAFDRSEHRSTKRLMILPDRPLGSRPSRPPMPVRGFAYQGRNAQGRDEYVQEQTGIKFVLIPAGTFSTCRKDLDARRARLLTRISIKPFLLAKFEVTQAQWQGVMATVCDATDAKQPAYAIAWDKANEFCLKTGLTLPTQAQWEYACHADEATCPGDDVLDTIAWCRRNSRGSPQPVGTKKPNAWGLHDMLGNVAESCLDEVEVPNPRGGRPGSFRVVCGGDETDDRDLARPAHIPPRGVRPKTPLGFRVVKLLDQ